MRSVANMLAYEAKKKPELAQYVANALHMTDAEIDALPYMKWIRQALKDEKRKAVHADLVRDAMQHIVDGVTPDPIGMTCVWTDQDTFIAMNGSRGHLLVKTGELVWFPKTGGVWIDTAFSSTIDTPLRTYIEVRGEMTRSQYTNAVSARRNGNQTQNIPHTVVDDASMAATGMRPSDDRGLFRIQRH